ncbi:MAG: hypothetical protein Q9184_004124, partial [Pyrenodesmia sp. 2 TL-2023]
MPLSFKPPDELNLSAFEENIQATFLVVNYLSNLEFGRKSVLEKWGTLTSTQYPSKRALEASFFGRTHGLQDICHTGTIWYGKSLKKLARDLDDPKTMYSTSVLRSTIVLTIYEANDRENPPLATFQTHQTNTDSEIAKAVADGKRTFLEQPDWLVIPWELDQNPKSHLEKLFDIGCRIPGLIEDRQRLSVQKQKLAQALMDNQYEPQPTLQEAYHSAVTAVVARCDDCLHQLRVWKSAWDLQSDLATVPQDSSTIPAGNKYPYDVFGLPLTFGELSEANRYTMYHSIQCTFLAIAYEVNFESLPLSTDIGSNAINKSLILKPGLVPPSTEHDHLLTQRHNSAVEICRSAPYHYMNEEHGCCGAYVVVLPLLAARQVFVPGGKESRYIDSMLPCFTEKTDSGGQQGILSGMRFVNMAEKRFVNLANMRYK